MGNSVALKQYIFTLIMHYQADPDYAYNLCRMSVGICNDLGITGRVFANDIEALAILEGPVLVIDKYVQSINADPLVNSLLIHSEKEVADREFSDYSIWLKSEGIKEHNPQIHALTNRTLSQAFPETMSTKVRILATAFLGPLAG